MVDAGFVQLSDGRLAPAGHAEGDSAVGGSGNVRWLKTPVLDCALIATGVRFRYDGIGYRAIVPIGDDRFTPGEEAALVGAAHRVGLRTAKIIEGRQREQVTHLGKGLGFSVMLPQRSLDEKAESS